jgi:hypothetical protein
MLDKARAAMRPWARPKIGLFFGAMMAAAALSMLRGLLVAEASTAAEFSRYAVTLSTGYFLGYLLSFGAVEETYKQFPRLFAQGGFTAILGLTASVFSQLGARGGVLVVASVALWVVTGSNWFFELGLAIMFALVSSYTSAVASVQRALSNHGRLAGANLMRSALAFVLVVPGAYLSDIRWVIAGELVAGVLGFLASCKLAGLTLENLNGLRPSLHSATNGVLRGVTANKGLLVSVSAIITSVPYYLDRMFVAEIFTTSIAASYALLAIFLSAATLLINTIAQRIGAETIKMVLGATSLVPVIRYVCRWSFLGVGVWWVFMLVVGVAFHFKLLPDGLLKYEIPLAYLYPVAMLGALGVTGLVEFLLLAVDEERKLFRSALSYFAVILLFSVLVWHEKLGILQFLWLMVVARVIYLSLLCISLAPKVNLEGGRKSV